jgi:hypothetical protein
VGLGMNKKGVKGKELLQDIEGLVGLGMKKKTVLYSGIHALGSTPKRFKGDGLIQDLEGLGVNQKPNFWPKISEKDQKYLMSLVHHSPY